MIESTNWWCDKHKIYWNDANWICCPFCNGQLDKAGLKKWQFHQNQETKEEKTMSKIFKYELGDNLIDTVTGFVGTVTCRAQWFNGCIQYCLKPKMVVKKDDPHKMPDGEYIDQGQLEYLVVTEKQEPIKEKEKIPGGPQSDYSLESCKS